MTPNQWSGHLRATRSGAAHRRVGHQAELACSHAMDSDEPIRSVMTVATVRVRRWRPLRRVDLKIGSGHPFLKLNARSQPGPNLGHACKSPRRVSRWVATNRPLMLRLAKGSKEEQNGRWLGSLSRSDLDHGRARAEGCGVMLVCGLKLGGRAREATERALALMPNQPMERTPPCCALRRRSSAR